jgi:hypothetical protein
MERGGGLLFLLLLCPKLGDGKSCEHKKGGEEKIK